MDETGRGVRQEATLGERGSNRSNSMQTKEKAELGKGKLCTQRTTTPSRRWPFRTTAPTTTCCTHISAGSHSRAQLLLPFGGRQRGTGGSGGRQPRLFATKLKTNPSQRRPSTRQSPEKLKGNRTRSLQGTGAGWQGDKLTENGKSCGQGWLGFGGSGRAKECAGGGGGGLPPSKKPRRKSLTKTTSDEGNPSDRPATPLAIWG